MLPKLAEQSVGVRSTDLWSGNTCSADEPEKSDRGIVGRESPADSRSERQLGSRSCQEGDETVVEIGDFAVSEGFVQLPGSGMRSVWR